MFLIFGTVDGYKSLTTPLGGESFFGDFFGNGEMEELEKALEGVAIDAQLEQKLEKLNLNHYMSGITPAELSSLIRG